MTKRNQHVTCFYIHFVCILIQTFFLYSNLGNSLGWSIFNGIAILWAMGFAGWEILEIEEIDENPSLS